MEYVLAPLVGYLVVTASALTLLLIQITAEIVCTNRMTCQNGKCACPPGWILCNGVCTDTNVDPDNCGACRRKCDPALELTGCQKGICMCRFGPFELPQNLT
ncbi:16771_t:CDS:2 [Acaulospora morrowiae]|uniref:16771_t:CDS:1 n=1 Tax=Acaulospora morrowiae TaxID=94023 RepID=A0A9N8VLC0_9GLOM|nr:16771_t:CDS:2 [Acaulospora morrowiae]